MGILAEGNICFCFPRHLWRLFVAASYIRKIELWRDGLAMARVQFRDAACSAKQARSSTGPPAEARLTVYRRLQCKLRWLLNFNVLIKLSLSETLLAAEFEHSH